MSLTGPSRRPLPSRPSISDLLAGIHGAYGVTAASTSAHDGQGRRAHLAARRHHRSARPPGHPVDGGGRGPPRAANHHLSTPRTAFHCKPTACSRSRRRARATGSSWPRFGIDPGTPGFATTGPGATGRADRRSSRGPCRPRRRRAGQAGRGRCPGWPGPDSGPGLRVGPDPVAGPPPGGGPPCARPIKLPGPPLRFDDYACWTGGRVDHQTPFDARLAGGT